MATTRIEAIEDSTLRNSALDRLVETGKITQETRDAYGLKLEHLHNPLAFIEYYWPGTKIYDKQEETLLSVRDNNETFVHSANECGKTKCTSLAVLWFFCTRFPAKVVTSSSSEKQLKQILWSEIDFLIRTAVYPLGIDQQTLKLQVLDENRIPYGNHYVTGTVTNSVENFQGHHLPRDPDWLPRVLFAFDEASGIPDEFYHAAQSQAHRLLVTSNPLSTDGFLFRECNRKPKDDPDPYRPGKFYRKVIHIDALDSPNVKIGMEWEKAGRTGMPPTLIPGLIDWHTYKFRERVWDPIKRQMRLHGFFYQGIEYLLFPPDYLDAAENAWDQVWCMKRGPCFMGVDPAEGGGDLTAWSVIDWLGIVDQVVKNTRDTNEINPITMNLMGKWHIPARRVVYDKGGGGNIHVNSLRGKGIRARAISFGGSPKEKEEYKNRRAEIYGLLAKALDPSKWSKIPPSESGADGDVWRRCFAIPRADDPMMPHDQRELVSRIFSPELREELAVLPTLYDAEGRLYLPPKNRQRSKKTSANSQPTIREMIGRSPDRADSLALAVYARDGGVTKKVARVDPDRVMAADPEQMDREARQRAQPQAQQQEQGGWFPGGAVQQRPKTLAERLFGGNGGGMPADEGW